MGDPTDFQLAVKYGRENDALKAELAKQRQLRDDTLARLAESELNRGLAAAIHKEVEAERDRAQTAARNAMDRETANDERLAEVLVDMTNERDHARAMQAKHDADTVAAEARAERAERDRDRAMELAKLTCQQDHLLFEAGHTKATEDAAQYLERIAREGNERSCPELEALGAEFARLVRLAIHDTATASASKLRAGAHRPAETKASMSTARVIPTADGGLAVYFDSAAGYALIEIHETGEVTAGHHAEGDHPATWPIGVEPGDVADAWERLCEFVGDHRPKDGSTGAQAGARQRGNGRGG